MHGEGTGTIFLEHTSTIQNRVWFGVCFVYFDHSLFRVLGYLIVGAGAAGCTGRWYAGKVTTRK